MGIKPLRFIVEPIQAQFDQPPTLEKKPGCPDEFVWRGETYRVIEILSEWHDYAHRGRMAVNMRPEHAATASRRGSWGVGRDYYRVRTDTGRIFDLYYDRAPKKAGDRKGGWFLYREMSATTAPDAPPGNEFDESPLLMEATLCFLVRGNPPHQILLGLKKLGFGAGKYGGFGGKVEAGETTAMAAVRELEEETGIKVLERDLQRMGHLTFLFPAKPDWSQVVHVFLVTKWDGNPVESTEMIPAWFAIEDIPFQQMWQDVYHWLPRALTGERIRASFTFKEDNETIDELEIEAWVMNWPKLQIYGIIKTVASRRFFIKIRHKRL